MFCHAALLFSVGPPEVRTEAVTKTSGLSDSEDFHTVVGYQRVNARSRSSETLLQIVRVRRTDGLWSK